MNKPGSPRSGWLAIAAAVVGLVLVLGVDWGNDAVPTPAPVAAPAPDPVDRPVSPFADAPPVVGPDAPDRVRMAAAAASAMAVEPPGSGGAPPGMTPQQWQQLVAALQDQPERVAELTRIASYLGFSARVQHFQTQRTVGARGATLAPLAQQLQTEVAQRLDHGELSMAEAESLQTELLEVLEPDAARRDQALDQWRDQHASAGPPEIDPRESELVRQQAAAIESWQALPAEQRHPDQLQAELQAIRDSVFAARP